MNFHVLTLFPEMIENGMNTSITGRAITKGLLTLEAVNIRDYAFNKHQKVDDYTYGGGAGMLMQAEPVYLAYEAIANRTAKKPRVVYLTPQGQVFNQAMAREMAQEIFDFGLIVIEGPLMLFLTDPPDATFLKRPRRQFPDFIHPPRFSLQLVVQLLRLFLVPRTKRLSNSFP